MFKAIIFDVNGVIIDDESVHQKAFREVCGEFSVEITSQFYDEFCFGRTDKEAFGEIIKKFNLKNVSPEELVVKKVKLYLQFIKGNTRYYPGVHDLLSTLKGKFKLAVTSSANREEVMMTLDGSGIREFFDVIVTGDDISNGKPDPEPYLLTARKLNEDNKNCLVIEDSPTGVASAKAAGMKCFGIITTSTREELREADFVARSFDEINREIFKSAGI